MNTKVSTKPNCANTKKYVSPPSSKQFTAHVSVFFCLLKVTKVKNVKRVQFGRHILECWYFSPFPKEYYPDGPVDCLYFCEFTMRFFRTAEELHHYQSNPELPRHPPGNEIYRDDQFHLSVFEIDGGVEKIYCQNLCYFAKLFLDHKTLYYDVDPFLFYVICDR